jgi:hypothetical protein
MTRLPTSETRRTPLPGRSRLRAQKDALGRADIARILMILVGSINGGRSADPSARSLYETKKPEYRP